MNKTDSQDNKRSRIWGIIRGRYGVEPDLSFPLWDLPLFLIALKIFGMIPLVYMSRTSSNYYYPVSFTEIAIHVLLSITTSLFFYFLAITPPLLIRFMLSKKTASTLSAVFLTLVFIFLHVLEMSFFYLGIFNQPIPAASGWATTFMAIGSYKILKYPEIPKVKPAEV